MPCKLCFWNLKCQRFINEQCRMQTSQQPSGALSADQQAPLRPAASCCPGSVTALPAEEPLALCALAGLAGASTSVVLAGDPKQLGPIIHSGVAREAGLKLSLLERLTGMPPYAAVLEGSGAASGNGASSAAGLIVKLVRNYRSHHKLLELPSRLFYQGELQACASPEITHTLLPNKT